MRPGVAELVVLFPVTRLPALSLVRLWRPILSRRLPLGRLRARVNSYRSRVSKASNQANSRVNKLDNKLLNKPVSNPINNSQVNSKVHSLASNPINNSQVSNRVSDRASKLRRRARCRGRGAAFRYRDAAVRLDVDGGPDSAREADVGAVEAGSIPELASSSRVASGRGAIPRLVGGRRGRGERIECWPRARDATDGTERRRG